MLGKLNYSARCNRLVKGSNPSVPDELLKLHKFFSSLDEYMITDIDSTTYNSKSDGQLYTTYFFEVYEYGNI